MATFGNAEFGQFTFPPTTGTLRTSAGAPLSIEYEIIPQSGQGLLISYTVQAFTVGTLPIIYYITPHISDFSINGVLFPRPHHLLWILPAEVGSDLSGVPVKQGFTSVQWQYDVQLDAEMSQLLATYDPTSPTVIITYPNELGFWVQKKAQFQPPDFGTRTTIEHKSVTLTFTQISSD